MGRDADTGGQIKYVLELAHALGKRKDVARVDLFTRWIRDPRVSSDYGEDIEPLDDKTRIVRIRCGGGKYIRKELLWPHLDEYVDKTLKFIKKENLEPDIFHGHYADGGYVAMMLASMFGRPFVFTGHSMGKNKRKKLIERGMTDEEINKRFHMHRRMKVEEKILTRADLVNTSTQQEITHQFGLYENCDCPSYLVNPPGLELDRFFPYYDDKLGDTKDESYRQARLAIINELNRFLLTPDKPLILALSRPEQRKNISALIQAFGENKELQTMANMAVFLGIRRDISDMEENEREVLTDTLLLMDKYDLYGKMAIPKKHDFTFEVPELFRITAESRGVFVNPALVEPFGLTLLEAGACGAPIVATNDGGPIDIIAKCHNGILVDSSNPSNLAEAITSIIVDTARWTEFSNNGINNVRKYYTWEAHIDRYLERIQMLLHESPRSQPIPPKITPVAKRLIHLKKIIITDIDNTLIGEGESLSKLLDWVRKHRDSVGFGVATGRPIDTTLNHLAEHGVDQLDIIISSVGSEIYYENENTPDSGWATHIGHKWDKRKIKTLMEGLDFVHPQKDDFERDFKLSYFVDPKEEYFNTIREVLDKNRCHYTLIYSHKTFLDFLPYRASKGKAIRYISYKWEIPLENFLVCGDSGNDEEMLRGDPRGVVVGNYSSELERLRGKRKIYFAKKKYAAGILEGIDHYGFVES
jgi:sucrose-phosphate synthase